MEKANTDHNKVIIKNAHTHNLKNINIEIPKHKLVVFTGVSGSGKSSLVFDTIYTEAQRQLVETFSTFARRRLPKLSRPEVDVIKNISTAIIIDQKKMGNNMRSTVGTATEIYTHLRLLYSRCGDKFIGPSFLFSFNHPSGMCPDCMGLGMQISTRLDLLLNMDKSIREGAINHPDYKVGGWNWREMVGVEMFDVDMPLKDFPKDELDKLLYAEAIPIEKKHGAGTYSKNFEGIVHKLERYHIGKADDENSYARKQAFAKYFEYGECKSCKGTRINQLARSVKINNTSIDELVTMEFTDLDKFLSKVDHDLGKPMIRKMRQTLSHLINIGAGYLYLNRAVSTLSGGESQRVKMARQLDCDLVDMMYILDEPSIGLHPRDNSKLINVLQQIKGKGNSVFVVEHDPDIIKSADWIVDIGPKAGINGGELIFSGTLENLPNSGSITAKYLKNPEKAKNNRKKPTGFYEIKNANKHNLKNLSIKIPKGVLTCVTGVAGSGKSSLVHESFVKNQQGIVVIDQSPAGKSVRANPATYTGIFEFIRKDFAKATNTNASLFSFNSKGACPKCNGLGFESIEMSFLDDIKIVCGECNGKKYKDEVLQLKYKGKNIYEVLKMTINQAFEFLDNPKISKRLQVLIDVGLGYLEVGQPLSTLSGGEAQRIKIASELHKNGNIYVMDEPTTGLHMADIDRLTGIIKRLVQNNNTVLIIEHNLDIIKHADWIIDMGPEGGARGGEVLFEGTPEDLAKCEKSFTGRYLGEILGG